MEIVPAPASIIAERGISIWMIDEMNFVCIFFWLRT